jgi:RNA polymerase sigma-70 factor (ECF subfamily)
MRGYTDEQLLSMLKQGDQAALTEIHSRYYAVLYAHAYKRFPYREEIRDILQELFTYLWNNRESLKLSTGLPAYLYASVRNRILNIYRNNKVRVEYAASIQAFAKEGETIADERLREKELLRMVEWEIAALPSQMRIIFELSRNHDLSHIEIAEKLGLSPQTVRTQVRNALRILRVKLGTNIFFILF